MEGRYMINLYHGSNVSIEQIDLNKGHKGKDFGKGFYLSETREQATAMAKVVTAREGVGVPTLNIFQFDDKALKCSDLRVKVFSGYDEEWARFILLNRQNKTDIPVHDYDIVYGPIADDRVGYQIYNLMKGTRTMQEFVEGLKFIQPTFQYYFGTEHAIQYLKKI